ncbi:MAG: hypothetical protein N3B13_08500 [Deltaproteobacteria bacterium]|nr:hypothetical protein [Deltaproteobacteria bacterium]
MRKIVILAIILILLWITGCIRHHRSTNIHLGFIFVPFTAGGNTEKVYTHDDHIHDEFCGHTRKWYNDRWVYYYNGFWEYYDFSEKVYYYIPAELLENE